MLFQWSDNFVRIEQIIRSYIVKRLLPLAKSDLAAAEVVVPLGGMNSVIRIVRTKTGQGFVVRVFPRAERARLRSLIEVGKMLQSRGVAVPPTVDWVEDYSESHLVIHAERLIEGQTLVGHRAEASTAHLLASLFHSLHRTKSPQWGPPDNLESADFSIYSFRRAKNRLRGVRKVLTRTADKAVFEKILDWFTAERHRFDGVREFDLTHDKINPGNLLWAPAERKYYLLDLATVRFGVRTKDLVALYHEVLQEDPKAIAQFETAYWAGSTDGERQQNERLWRWYHAYYHLAEAASQIKRAHNATARYVLADSDYYEKFRRHWDQLLAVIHG
ncbi:MAG: aminoglycoside phosphotransferase family protein [Candidatus Sumerlaeia bacterium]|nr:aminoglycoside phosphotransferase family protein [Candidatus Sumerlaeia bacterium]